MFNTDFVLSELNIQDKWLTKHSNFDTKWYTHRKLTTYETCKNYFGLVCNHNQKVYKRMFLVYFVQLNRHPK